ncbi:MAG: hypothetical protein HZB53_15450 [Chloroflexi bacterium]|nr:hypothetical protein [Chloroflexota bacterium]
MSNENVNPDAALPLTTMQRLLEKHLDVARVEAVYGEPVVSGDTIVIPAAELFSVVGVGVGGGAGPSSADGGAQEHTGYGSGGGGGGRVLARPVAAIVIRPDGVAVQPIVDVTKIGLAALTAIGFMAGMMATMGNRRHAMRAIQGKS